MPTTTTTTSPAEERLVSGPDGTVLFMCRRADLRLVKRTIYPMYGEGGRVVGQHKGETVAFRDGVLRVPKDGKFTLEDQREIDGAEVIEWLEAHRLFADLNDGFWRVDPPPPPVSHAEQQALLDIVLELDEDKLVEFIEQERAGWGREDLLDSAEKALEKMRARAGGA